MEVARPSGSKRVSGVAYFRFSNLSPTCEIICIRMEYTTIADDAPVQYLLSLKRQERKADSPKEEQSQKPDIYPQEGSLFQLAGEERFTNDKYQESDVYCHRKKAGDHEKGLCPCQLASLMRNGQQICHRALSTYLCNKPVGQEDDEDSWKRCKQYTI